MGLLSMLMAVWPLRGRPSASAETVFADAFDQQGLYKEVTLKTPSNSMKADMCSC